MNIRVDTPQMKLWKIGEEYYTVPHVHEREYQITVPIYGSCLFSRQSEAYELAVGDGFVQYPEESHVLQVGPGAGVIVIQVDRTSLAQFYGHQELELEMRQRIDPEEIHRHFRKWTAALLLPDQLEPLAVQETEMQVLYYISRVLKGNQLHKRDAALAGTAASDRHMALALDYMHEHFTEKLNIDTLAGIALQSRFHFIRSFKSIVGVTPYQYLLSLRIEEAKTRLRRTFETVTEISFHLGFSSTSQFYRAFVKTVGITPEQYRSEFRH
ncbi:helix-turn-helix domain-containing protein [Brevibacillus sp. B_LB10_24]|uniref:helix-turn-helix domain-containing protein n=1 Tax=Brevibacillus sp. B_LB10_24 TaxID=3380645 RepID=UPI0038BC200D